MRVLALLLCALVLGCQPSRSANLSDVVYPPVSAPVETGYGTIEYDLRATPAEVAAGTAYVLPFMKHWAPYSSAPFAVVIVRVGDLHVAGADRNVEIRGCRRPLAGHVWLTYGPSFEVYAAEWELPLVVQGVQDPLSWTWGTWGPIYPGMAPWALAASQ